jgi:2-haloalkanoic acid dehalogenase type II
VEIKHERAVESRRMTPIRMDDGLMYEEFTTFKALSFDCYGTLIDWETGIGSVLVEWAQSIGISANQEQLLNVYADHEAAVEAEFPSMPYPQVLEQAFTRVGVELGYEVSEKQAEKLGVSVPDWPAFADSHKALERLHRHYSLIILSNVNREGFDASEKRLGIQFDEILVANEIGSYKPSPRNFHALLSRIDELGLQPDQLLHVAQSLFHDHVPAQKQGLKTVWINRRHNQPGWGATPEPSAEVYPTWESPL